MGVTAALFSLRRLKNFENEKNFLCLEIAEIDRKVNFGSERTILDITYIFLRLNPFCEGEYPNVITCERGSFVTSYLLN